LRPYGRTTKKQEEEELRDSFSGQMKRGKAPKQNLLWQTGRERLGTRVKGTIGARDEEPCKSFPAGTPHLRGEREA